MTNAELEALFNDTFPGLTFFYRDADLDKKLIAKYQPFQILLERGFTDVSYKGGGLSKNCRYLIASNKGRDMSMFNPEVKQFGLITLMANSYFKVLDIQKQGDKTQILLLQIPPAGKEFFSTSKINIEDQIIEKASASFAALADAEPVPELESIDWIKRTSFPLGMSENGVFF